LLKRKERKTLCLYEAPLPVLREGKRRSEHGGVVEEDLQRLRHAVDDLRERLDVAAQVAFESKGLFQKPGFISLFRNQAACKPWVNCLQLVQPCLDAGEAGEVERDEQQLAARSGGGGVVLNPRLAFLRPGPYYTPVTTHPLHTP
jgi:hypothetical protein